ncbi:MAG: SPFH domain-containing protein [Acutalibacteraceae bacterium]|nr:SPFH domain-containing protein [Acutalibacteraceae bacterium]
MAKIIDVIKYEGDNSTFIWKHPAEDFNILSQLIVHESQEAIFFKNGQALDSFGPGRYTLTTQNIPLLSNLLNLATGGESPFHCEVYFINKTIQMSVKWGTDSKVRFIDSLTGVPIELGASGEMNLKVSDSRKLLVKLVGTANGIAWGSSKDGFSKSLNDCFRPFISTAVKTNLPTAIKQSEIDILEIDERLEELSGVLKDKIIPGFEEYGLTIPQLYVTTIVLPEDDPNFKKIRELHTISFQKRMVEAETEIRTAKAEAEAEVTAAQRQIELERQTTETEVAKREAERELIRAQTEAQAAKMAGFAEAEVMAAKGITEKEYVQADVQKAFAEGLGNMGGDGAGGGVMGDIVGLGVGLQAAGAMSGQLGGIFNGFVDGAKAPETTADIRCANCGNSLPANAKFCLECGTKVENLAEKEMICPACGKKTAKGKFCMECGASLILKCEKCGAEIPNGAKFCLECGEKL